MKYRRSNDGQMRMTLHPDGIRLTREELKEYNRMARVLGYKDYRDYINHYIGTIIMHMLDEYELHQENSGEDARK